MTKSSGSVTATLQWKYGELGVTHPRLTITREGRLAADLDVSDVCKDCSLIEDSSGSGESFTIMHVADFDGDHEPEVSFDTYSGGAHCCFIQRIYAYRPASGSYRRVLSQYWGNGNYDVKDLDGDGAPELYGRDDAFAYAFSSYASSVFPPKILDYTVDVAGQAKITDVTRRFPAIIRAQAATMLKEIRQAKPDPAHEIQGLIAAYVADQYLLGQRAVGQAELARARKRKLTAPGFQASLLKFLRQTGYR